MVIGMFGFGCLMMENKIKCPVCKKAHKFKDFKSMSAVGEWKLPVGWLEVLDIGHHLVFEVACRRCSFPIEKYFSLKKELWVKLREE